MLTNRQEQLLNILIDRYIKTAEPVSSKSLVKSKYFKLSSATLRNEMNGLERYGYLAQLHTSGGRIPTDKAYRFYVDNLLGSNDFNVRPIWQKKIDGALAHVGDDPRNINKTIAQLLSGLSESIVIAGISEQDDFYKTGLASMFDIPEFREFDRMFKLTSFFEEFDRMFDQLEGEFFRGFYRPNINEGVNILIGRENGHPAIRDETVMTVRYGLPNDYTGSLTLIGPMRMDYKKNIGLIRYTAGKLNKLVRKI